MIPINDLSDPRIAVYRDLRDADLRGRHGRFIAEGENIVRRLVASRKFPVESVLCIDKLASQIGAILPPEVPLYVCPSRLVSEIVGFKFHNGVIGCGLRRDWPALAEVLPRDGDALVVVCPEIANAENLGGILRLSAGLGASAMLLGERCCDPLVRQTIRVSMGTVFQFPLAQSRNVMADLIELKSAGVVRVASVIDDDAPPLHEAVKFLPRRVALLLGNEAQGLSREQADACDVRVRIPMHWGVDSLNVAVAAGIMLHALVHR
jgi:tRNA G18 (ribose-2'-O)-methylase SpoU